MVMEMVPEPPVKKSIKDTTIVVGRMWASISIFLIFNFFNLMVQMGCPALVFFNFILFRELHQAVRAVSKKRPKPPMLDIPFRF
jgi:hypothetical protein